MTRSNKSITVAAGNAAGILRRFQAVELEADRIAGEQNGSRMVRAVLDDNGLHVLMRDEHGAVLEIAEGKVAISVTNGEEPGE